MSISETTKRLELGGAVCKRKRCTLNLPEVYLMDRPPGLVYSINSSHWVQDSWGFFDELL